VLEPVLTTAIELLSQSIALQNPEGRGVLAYLLRVFPLLNREARDLWRKEPMVASVLTFCDFFFDSGHRKRYMDGVLPSLDLGNLAEDVPGQRVLELVEIQKTRAECAHAVGGTVGQLVARICEMHHSFATHASYTRSFCQCQRVGCTRPALIEPPEEEPDESEPSSASEYWSCCRDGRSAPPSSSLPSDMSFCSNGCFKATNAEFKKFVKFEITTPLSETRRGADPTPSRLYRAVVSRNMSVMRRVRSQSQVKTTHYPSTMANREKLVRDQTIMLSVDLGVLYAATIVHQLPKRLRPKRELPCKEDWRNKAGCYLSAICRVRSLYLKYGNGILTRGANDLWLRRLRDEVLTIF